MMQTKDDCLAFLAEARAALDELSVMSDREKQLRLDEDRMERTLEAERKAVADNIRLTVKKRAEEISDSYDKEIVKGQEQLKRIRSKREKEKSKRVKDRIEEETATLHEYNRDLKLKLKSLFQQKHVPRYCRSSLYYSLYFPRWFKEFLVFFAMVLVFFLAIPCGVYYQIPERQPLYLAGIYLLDILIFGGAYIGIGNKGKLHHLEALKEGRKIRDQIHSNNKRIKVIVSTIRKDRNESLYNLEHYDDEIAKVEQELTRVTEQKKEALNTFETVTRNILADEITHNSQERLDSLQQEYDQAAEQLRITEAQVKERRLYITDHYGMYLGSDLLDPLKIAELTALIQEDKAKNISEAVEICQAPR